MTEFDIIKSQKQQFREALPKTEVMFTMGVGDAGLTNGTSRGLGFILYFMRQKDLKTFKSLWNEDSWNNIPVYMTVIQIAAN